jgi:glycolate oxidase FAD binding subunit
VLSHASADLTATVEAGATVDDVNATLARHRQWLPIDPSREGATIGGAVAANDTGPLRHRYGTPRDLLIGVQLATTDGRLVKAGGIVVKNVAGYDLGKLVSGSFGTLAAITTVTFKLLPMPDSWQTLAAAFPNHDGLAHAVTLLNDSQLEPVAVELQASPAGRHDPPYESAPYPLLVRFGGVPAAVAAQVGQARALIAAGEVLSGEPEAALWRRYQARAAASAGAVIKMSWLPAALPDVLAMVQEIAGSSRGAGSVELAGRAAVGSGLLKIDGATDWQAAVVDRLRARADVVRHVTLREATVALKDRVDVWGSLGPAATLGLAIKRALDPVGILNAGRGPI